MKSLIVMTHLCSQWRNGFNFHWGLGCVPAFEDEELALSIEPTRQEGSPCFLLLSSFLWGAFILPHTLMFFLSLSAMLFSHLMKLRVSSNQFITFLSLSSPAAAFCFFICVSLFNNKTTQKPPPCSNSPHNTHPVPANLGFETYGSPGNESIAEALIGGPFN